MEQVLKNYLLRFDELNVLAEEIKMGTFFDLGREDARRKFEECLFWFYVDGFESGILMLNDVFASMDDAEMYEEFRQLPLPNGYEYIDKEYSDGTVLQKLDDYITTKDANRLTTLLESESHRMYNQGSTDAADGAVKIGAKVKKTWHTMRDDRVRDMHWTLEGVTIPYEEDFVTADGDTGKAPGMFSNAENNANCRCWLTYR